MTVGPPVWALTFGTEQWCRVESQPKHKKGLLDSGRHCSHRSRRSRDRRCRGLRHNTQSPARFQAGRCSRNLTAACGLCASAPDLPTCSSAVPTDPQPGVRLSSRTSPPVSESLCPATFASGPAAGAVNSCAAWRTSTSRRGTRSTQRQPRATAVGWVMPCGCEGHKLSDDSRGAPEGAASGLSRPCCYPGRGSVGMRSRQVRPHNPGCSLAD